MTKQIIEFELAEDVQDFIAKNDDVGYLDNNFALKEKIEDANPSDLLKVVKTIDSPTTIVSVDYVDDEFLENEL